MMTPASDPVGTAVLSQADRAELESATSTIVTSLYPISTTREFIESPRIDKGAWLQLAAGYELLGLHVPTALGGQGLSFSHTAIVAQEMGRQLVPAPYLATVSLAISHVLRLGTEQQQSRLLPQLVAGQLIGTVAATGLFADPLDVIATAQEGGYALTGQVSFVPHGLDAELLLVLAKLAGTDDTGVFIVTAGAAGLDVTAQETLDPSRPQASLSLRDCPAELLGDAAALADHSAQQGRERAAAEATILLASEAVGGADGCLRMTVDYVKMRHQFGRAVGSFQAVQHQLANLHGELESARATVEWAVALVDSIDPSGDPAAVLEAASFAKARASQAFATIARETIHLHGGIGFTWEHDAHLYFKRALADQQLLGGPAAHRARIVSTLGR